MRRPNLACFFIAVIFAGASLPAFSYNPPAGGALLPVLGSPEASIAGLTVTALDSPWADRLNPAASAGRQRNVLSLGYQALTDFGSQGLGTAIALGMSLPQPYGVIGAGLRFVSTPATMTSMNLGTLVVTSGSISKALFPNLYVGAGLDLSLGVAAAGGAGTFGWGLGLDLGFVHFLGDLGPFLDFRWGGALTGIGRGFTYATPANGVLDPTAVASAFPAPFTPAFGAEALLLRGKDWKIGASLQLSFPSFQDLSLSMSANASWRKVLTLKTAWGFDLREILLADSKRSLIPSLTLAGSIPLVRKADASFLSQKGWDRSELSASLAALPLYGSVVGVGASAVLSLGVVDRVAPVITAAVPKSSWGPVYLSPNNDGSNDSLVFPLDIKDQRYIESFALVIRGGDVGDEAGGSPVRTIGNKETRPDSVNFDSLWKRLTYVQKGLAIPPTLTWDGRADDGSTVPDGIYSVFVEATDDNGNKGVVGPYKVVVDRTAPVASIAPVESSLIFSPDGDGNKDSISFGFTVSVEDLWTLTLVDAGGNVLITRTYKDQAPTEFTWDGKTDSGGVAPDGVYSVILTSKDRAGNVTTVRVDNIIVNTQQAPINISIDQSSFSPNGDGRKDSLAINTSVPVKAGLVSWRLAVVDRNKIERWVVSGTDPASLPARVDYNGRDTSGRVLAEGQYQASLSAWYSNGHNPRVLSPLFTIDLTPPAGTAKADRQSFNPAGSEGQNRITFALGGSREDRWLAEVLPANAGSPVRVWTMATEPDASLEWDGTDDQGRAVGDGSYSFRLSSSDRAGNVFASPLLPILIDTEKKAVRLSADQRSFSPNGDGVKDQVRFTTSVLSKDKVKSFVLTVEAADNATSVSRIWKGTNGLADSYTWDGLDGAGIKVPDGRYLARLKVSYQNGDEVEAQTPALVLDSIAPSISASAAPLLFSPNGDGRQDLVTISQSSSAEEAWLGSIIAADKGVIRSFTWKGQAPTFTWDGTDEAGNLVKDGSYSYEVASTDAAGNKGQAAVSGMVLDNRVATAFVTASETGISPNGDGYKDFVSFSAIVTLKEGISAWRLAVTDKAGVEQRVYSGTKEVPARIDWDGKDIAGKVLQGDYAAFLSVDYLKGDRSTAKSSLVSSDVEGPSAAISVTPEYFSPDNDGVDDELTFAIAVSDASSITDWKLEIAETAVVEGGSSAKPGERSFISWGGKGAPAPSIVWDGRSSRGELVEAATDYPFYFTIKDSLGNVTKLKGSLAVDVLVMKDGDRLKIKVPSIVFRANYADFVDLDAATIERNAKVIKRIAQILNRFKDYRIRIEGNANSVGKIIDDTPARIADEETKELVPLSLGRADLVRKLLIEDGVDAARLTTTGLGSSEPVVDFKDAVNRWKNRRVEFVLIKNK